MTNSLAIFLGIAIAAFLAADAMFFGWDLSLGLARRFADLIEWMAFWR